MSQPIVHFELWSNNPEAASRFYGSLFGWNINYNPQLSYWLVDTGAQPGGAGVNGGMFKPQEGPLPAKIALYMLVDDVEKYIKRAEAAGAKVIVPTTDIPGVGWSAVLLDPEDRAFGLFKPLALQPGPAPARAARKPAAKKKARAAASPKKPAKKARAAASSRKQPMKAKKKK